MNSPFDVFRKTEVVVRNSIGGEFYKGRWIDGVREETSALVNLQPLSAKETSLMMTQYEGRWQKKGYKIYSDLVFNVVGEENPTVIIFQGEEYEVISKSDWQRIGFATDHFKYIIAKEQVIND